MLTFGQTKLTKEIFYAAKGPVKLWGVNADNTVISKLIETNVNPKCLIGYLDEATK